MVQLGLDAVLSGTPAEITKTKVQSERCSDLTGHPEEAVHLAHLQWQLLVHQSSGFDASHSIASSSCCYWGHRGRHPAASF